VLAVLLLAVVATAIAACGGNGPATASPAPSQIESAQPSDVISWSEAAASVGQTLTVEGPVVSSTAGRGPGGAALLLNVGLDAPDPSRFVAIVPLAIYRRLSANTRAQLDIALVRVTGTIIGFRGASAIVVARRADLRLAQ
jgi:predicted small lipoprotein YifL